ncbi:MAG: hypothetical protein IJX96_02130 [Clostridia bacterium]|nr:hypothetical protein [Clostridia bacterium]
MNKEHIRIENWKLITVLNAEVNAKNVSPVCGADILALGYEPIKASVPGNFELDLMREGRLPDLYFGANVLLAQKLENLHLYYYTEFEYSKRENSDAFLVFNGIDTVAEIFLDGEKLGFVENMHHAHTFSIDKLADGTHTLLVHILPVCIYARQFEVPAMCYGLPYNHDSINVRKSPSMFGWDIMPRIVSGGIYKPVELVYLPRTRIENPFIVTKSLSSDSANLLVAMDVKTDAEFMQDYKIVVRGRCKDHAFSKEWRLFNAHQRICFSVDNPLLWWPKNYGEQNLYDVDFILYYKGIECDRVSQSFGIRTAYLRRSSSAGDNGDFCFIVNGKRIFCMGTNWVPTDAFPSRHEQYELRGLKMIADTQCNMLRCWGGNTYPSDAFYDFCDKNGLMVWQDFSLGCGHYTDDVRLCRLVAEEVKQVALRIRRHPSLVLYAGDNECDCFICSQSGQEHEPIDTHEWIDPNFNKLTRDVILRTLRNHDASRPYLPSSPYIDSYAFYHGLPSEDHIWGPRDYFKGEYYKNPPCHFASEIGYHGCPSPKSLEKFISKESINDRGNSKICTNPEWLAHATAMETDAPDTYYVYRIPLMVSQVERIFGNASDDISTFARQSQISQAEAVKYFIEHFRANNGRKTGLLWWNMIDGWPQISDAVVDWYGVKKLAYHYIKRSQSPFVMLLGEPENGLMELMATNDSRENISAEYTVKNLATGETVVTGKIELEADGKAVAETIPYIDHAFFLIEWKTERGNGVNHHACSLGDTWQYEQYINCMKKAGFYDEFEGF